MQPPLSPLPNNQYSQGGQDIYVTRILNKMTNGFFVDVGANNGIFISNTYLLERKFGWKGICVEASPSMYQQLLYNRPNSLCIQNVAFSQSNTLVDFTIVPMMEILNAVTDYADTAVEFIKDNGIIIKIQTKTLTDILTLCNAPSVVDYLSVDTNGTEPNVLEGIDFKKYMFKIISVENSNIPEKQQKINDILIKNDYIIYHNIKINDELSDNIYIHKSIQDSIPSNVK